VSTRPSTRSVSKAAETLHVTQSAMSHSLKRLRAMLGDELFTRRGRSLAPTELAIRLEPRLRVRVAPHRSRCWSFSDHAR